jgi:hypothetical protein
LSERHPREARNKTAGGGLVTRAILSFLIGFTLMWAVLGSELALK